MDGILLYKTEKGHNWVHYGETFTGEKKKKVYLKAFFVNAVFVAIILPMAPLAIVFIERDYQVFLFDRWSCFWCLAAVLGVSDSGCSRR